MPRRPNCPLGMTRRIVGLVLIVSATTGATLKAADANWPRWRGPEADGHTTDPRLPTTWTDADVAWKTALPGDGQSTPIIWGDRIFLTSALELGRSRLVFCIDRRDGKMQWQHTAWTGEPEPTHKMNGWASASCVTDGEIVAAFFGRGGLHVYTVEGKHLWSKELGTFESPWGVSACPILVDDLIVQNCDADVDAYIAAFDKRTGREVWKTRRPDNRGWSTPIVTTLGGRRELVLNGHSGVFAYDPSTGRELWFCASPRGRGEATVTPVGDLLGVINGQGGEFYTVKPGGDGDVTATRVAWHSPRKGRDTPSPLTIGNYVLVNDLAGFVSCYDATDGRLHYKERLLGPASGSPIAAGGLAYFLNEAGKTFVVEPAETLKIVAENELTVADDEIFRASLTPSGGQWFIRSTKTLYCIGKRP